MSRSLLTRWLKPTKTICKTTARVQPRLVSLEARDVPATLIVNSSGDDTVFNTVLTLREAITAINAGNISGLSPSEASQVSGSFGSNDTIQFNNVGPTLTLNGTQLPALTKSVAITGPRADKLTINAKAASGHFTFAQSGTTITISGMTLTGGFATSGGSITLDNAVQLTLADMVVTGNTAAVDGAAILAFSTSSSSKLTILRSTISNNAGGTSGSGSGGAIWTRSPTVIEGSTFSGNSTGGGVGGAINFVSNDRSRTITNSTFVGNSAKTSGGAIGIEAANGSLTIQNTTIVNNTAGLSGGGVARVNGTSQITMISTVVANNTATATADEDLFSTNAITALNCAITTATGVTTFTPTGTTATLLGQNFKLGTLGIYGGPVRTVALLAGSPLVDAGSNPAILTNDSRATFFSRVAGAATDIGAYESQSLFFTVTNPTDVDDGNFTTGQFSLREALNITNVNPGLDSIGINLDAYAAGTPISLQNGELPIDGPTAITGPGADRLTITGNNSSRVFNTSFAAANDLVTISGLTITNGVAQVGAGILVGDERLVLLGVTVSNNVSVTSGGGLAITSPNGSATITNSTFHNNYAQNGGAIDGHSTGSMLLVINSTFANNSAGTDGGAIRFRGDDSTASLTIHNSTISGNSAQSVGAGVFLHTVRPVNIESTIISGNTAKIAVEIFSAISSPITLNKSAIGASSLFIFNGSGNLAFGTDLKLRPLAFNGGPTQTVAFKHDSPLRNIGSNPAALTTDARGVARNNAGVDIGAFELNTVVISTADSGVGSLRAAVDESNRVIGLDVVTFDATFNAAQTITLTSEEIAVNDAVTITGPGAKLLTLSGNNARRIFNTSAAGKGESVTLSGLTLTQGFDKFGGGAIYAEDEHLTVLDSVVTGNSSNDAGGGIYFRQAGQLTLQRSTVSNNTATVRGGGIYFYRDGQFEIDSSTISGNQATNGDGGGLYFLGNVTGYDGLSIKNSTISGNSAFDFGGGIYVSGISSYDDLYIVNSTITGNSSKSGGGIANHDSVLRITLDSSIISGNSSVASLGSGPDVFSEVGINLYNTAVGDTEGFVFGFGDDNLFAGTDLKLGPLADNGGPTLTHLPAIDSPLRNAGDSNGSPTDQRGLPRTDGVGHTDIGAVQVQVSKIVSITRSNPEVINASSVIWSVKLAHNITGLSPANFTLSGPGALGASIVTVSGTGNTFSVVANTGSDGPLMLNFVNAIGLNRTPTNLPFAGPAYLVNKVAPTVTMLTADDLLLTDADVGPGRLTVVASFSEPMNTAVIPTFSFPVENPSGTLTFANGAWLSPTMYRGTFNVNDLNMSLNDIDVRISGGQDTAGTTFGSFTVADLIDVDTRNPIALNIQRANTGNTNLNTVSWTVTFSEAVSGVTAANFSLLNGGLSGIPTITTVSGSGNTYTVTAITGGGQGQLTLVVDNGANVTDAVGNTLAATPTAGGTYSIDHVSPAAPQLTLNTLTVSDANVGPDGFRVTAKFNEIMDQTVMPVVSFPAEFPASLTFNGGVWLDARTWQAKFNVADLGVTQNDIDLVISGGRDLAGNLQAALPAVDLFDIDTQNAVLGSITSNSPDGSYSVGNSIDVRLNFSEDLILSGAMTITLNTGAVVTITGPASGGYFSGTYVVAAGETSADLNVVAVNLGVGSTLRDAAGNLAVLALPTSNLAANAAIVVGATAPTVTSLVVNGGDVQRSRVTAVVVNFSAAVTSSVLSGVQLTSSSGAILTVGSGLVVTPAVGNPNSVALTFTGTIGVNFGSLSDGYWRVSLPALGYSSPQNDVNLRRLFGDVNADGTVDGGNDFSEFGSVFGLSTVDSPFDFNGDGAVEGGVDFAEFGSRFGLSL